MQSVDNSSEANRILDGIINHRRSIRVFRDETPEKEMINAIIQAGLLAPFANPAGKTLIETRKFVVLKKGTQKMKDANAIMLAQVQANSWKFTLLTKLIPYLRRHGRPFAKVLAQVAQSGIPAFRTAPYFIVIAERKGFPPVQKQSMAHALQNMWLKATALGLGFQLLSATQMMAKNKAFMNLLGLPMGVYEIDGCVVGYPAQTPAERIKIMPEEYTVWLE